MEKGNVTLGETTIWGVPKIRGTLLGVPKIRTIVFWGLYWGPPILGNDYITTGLLSRFHSTTGKPRPSVVI